jgi:hypothetical protein
MEKREEEHVTRGEKIRSVILRFKYNRPKNHMKN